MTPEVMDGRPARKHAWAPPPMEPRAMRKQSLSRHVLSPLLALAAALAAHGAIAAGATQPAAAAPQSVLDRLAGRWTVRQTIWAGQAGAPAVDRGSATFTPVLGGRHLRQELRIDSATPFEGLGYFGRDPAGGYESLWMDMNFDGVAIARGDYDAAAHAFTFHGEGPDASGARVPLREVLQVVDADHFTFEYYEGHGDGEDLAVRLEYARAD